MITVKCQFCRKFYSKSRIDTKCKECDEQLKTVVASITKRYDVALNRLASR